MFDNRLEAALGNRRALADLAAHTEHQSKQWGCRKLIIAAAWADAHSDVDHPSGGVLVERLVTVGPVGTPPVAEFAPQGLIGPFGTSIASARSWMGTRSPSGTGSPDCGNASKPGRCMPGRRGRSRA